MHTLHEKWKEIIVIGETFRGQYLSGVTDQATLNTYIAKLTRMWGELYPKLKNRNDLGADVITDFEAFKPYYFDPRLLASPDKAEDIFKLEMAIRNALEKLNITRYEK